jgi:hypothetical protein
MWLGARPQRGVPSAQTDARTSCLLDPRRRGVEPLDVALASSRGPEGSFPIGRLWRASRRRATSEAPLETKEHGMGQVIANASMSLDGYIAKDDNTIGRLFD